MDLRAGPSTAEGGTRSRPLRGKVLARPSSSCADDNDCLRVPPASSAHKSEAGKKESTAHLLNRRYRRSATPSSTSSCEQVLSDVRTANPGSPQKSSMSKSAKVVLALQLCFLFGMRFLCCGLMSAPPERPRDDVGGLNAFSRETLSYAADFLDRPRDEIGCLGVALDLVFLGVGLLA